MDITRFGLNFKVSDSDLNRFFFEKFYMNWEESTHQFLFKYLNKEKTFIDIGAWVGIISIVSSYFSKEVLAFEPDPVAYAELIENIGLNKIENIKPNMIAVSTLDTISLGCYILGQSGTRTSCNINAFESKCITMKDIFYQNHLTKEYISAIKIDIEGHEEILLQEEYIINLDIPMHVSLHPQYAKDRVEFVKNIKPFFEKRGIDIESGCYHKDFFDVEVP